MKKKLQKLTSKKIVIVPALILLVVLGSALAKGKPARNPVAGSGEADVYLNSDGSGYAVGQADISIRRVPQPQATVVVELDTPRYSDEGVLHATSEHTFYFGNGNSFTTADKVVGDPTGTLGLYRINVKLRVVSGTGIFEGAVGNLIVHGWMQFDDPLALTEVEVTYDIRGSISISEDSGNNN